MSRAAFAYSGLLWDIEKFAGGSISEGELERLRESFLDVQEELEGQRQEADAELRRIPHIYKFAAALVKLSSQLISGLLKLPGICLFPLL